MDDHQDARGLEQIVPLAQGRCGGVAPASLPSRSNRFAGADSGHGWGCDGSGPIQLHRLRSGVLLLQSVEASRAALRAG